VAEYLNLAITFISGGGLLAFLQYLSTRRKSSTDEFTIILDNYKKLYSELLESEKKCTTELMKVREDLQDLRGKVIVLESAHFDMPFPMWLKDMDFKMIALNPEYEKHFLLPMGKNSSDYLGKYDNEIWPAEIAAEYVQNDRKTLNSRNGYWYGHETIKISGSELTEDWRIVKYIRYAGKIPIGIAGIAIPVFNK
jgi:hypothetical protein